MTEMSMQGCIRETELLNTVAYIMLTVYTSLAASATASVN